MLIPFASLFVACGKNDGYNLNNLNVDFYNIANESDNIVNKNGRLEFDYSSHNNLNEVLNSTAPYTELTKYNEVFDNLMSFAFEYVAECSNNGLTDDANIKNTVEKDLASFKKSINDVDKNVNMFAEIINISYGVDVKADVCLLRYENLLVSYSKMFESAINFGNSLSNLYFNYILKDGNPNVYSIKLEDFNSSVVVNKLNSRVQYQISNLSQCFVEMYVDKNLAKQIANEETSFNLYNYNYLSNVAAIDKTFDEETASEIANNEANKEEFYNLSVQAQNLQSTLNNNKNKFVTACNDIDFIVINSNLDSANPHEEMCHYIILENYQLITEYNSVLSSMLNILAGV